MAFRFLKNLGIRSICALFPKARSNRPIKRCLAVATTGLGDSLWSTPAIHALKKSSFEIDLLTNPLGKNLFLHNPDIRKTFLIKEPLLWQSLRFKQKLEKERYDAAFIFHSSQRLLLPLLVCSGIPRIFGTKGQHKGLDSLLTDPVKTSLHEIDRRRKLIEEVGASILDPSLRYFFTEEEKSWGESWIQEKNPTKKPLVLLHPGAKDRYKCWPISHYALLGKRLEEELSCQIVIGMGAGEEDLGNALVQDLPKSLLAGPLPLRNYASLLGATDLIITNDTGPMHLACALKKPTLALFSPTDPKKCGPYDVPAARILKRPRSCSPCLGRSCRLPFCLRQISVRAAFEEAASLLESQIPFER
ncbi:MAG: glycosyltransferase family 9 protein [Chlamydiota bacterium]